MKLPFCQWINKEGPTDLSPSNPLKRGYYGSWNLAIKCKQSFSVGKCHAQDGVPVSLLLAHRHGPTLGLRGALRGAGAALGRANGMAAGFWKGLSWGVEQRAEDGSNRVGRWDMEGWWGMLGLLGDHWPMLLFLFSFYPTSSFSQVFICSVAVIVCCISACTPPSHVQRYRAFRPPLRRGCLSALSLLTLLSLSTAVSILFAAVCFNLFTCVKWDLLKDLQLRLDNKFWMLSSKDFHKFFQDLLKRNNMNLQCFGNWPNEWCQRQEVLNKVLCRLLLADKQNRKQKNDASSSQIEANVFSHWGMW